MQPLPRRQQQVLQATVRHYVDTTEPVGSQTLVKRFGLEASPATVRSAMGALEQKGLLTQPHTSAGRVPSQQGYRHYVDCLLPAPGAAASQLERELTGLSLQWAALDDLLLHLARRLADLTGLLSLITRPQRHAPDLQALRLVPSGDRLLVFLVEGSATTSSLNLRLPPGISGELPALERWAAGQLEGTPGAVRGGAIDWGSLPPQLRGSGELLRQGLESHRQLGPLELGGAVALGLGGLLRQPEFSRTESLRPLLQLVEEDPQQLLQARGAADLGGVWIGAEHPHPALRSCAVVQSSYGTGSGGVGHVALVGPMRMAYATARSAVRSVATVLERLLS
ncbi:HrcA family transcriptional regulator [Vulcanococcus limneticus]|uniref:HrcA family transcriptional regulator n=1 Tax=Vulcanococcus limneticus TaxID=2170428 RepID=UPI000B98D079|nr:HrcA family transcriptional regulator [Vulcanococcus limneticus]MCP9792098.1 HrcA family transcriptional regulator [Vulcanococcus limneticus MW73D5]MCP9893905.1 HrcA family transcriptional regulator [Vulcanococcus limneticus Candia 3F8]MCP9897488.1 HrcA family transcriptional regulator [Vulcanococcus limneticus Candia 3B3]